MLCDFQPSLERICEVDETVTRDKAVESIKIILGVMSHVDDKVVHVFVLKLRFNHTA